MIRSLGFLLIAIGAAGLFWEARVAYQRAEAAEQSLGRCVAASPAHTDTEVEAQWDACEKLLSHRRMIGR